MRRRIAQLCILFLGLALTAVLALVAGGLYEREARADLIVVPGNFVTSKGLLSQRLQARLDAALVLYQAGDAPLIFVSGGHGASGKSYDESLAMRDYLVERGVPAKAVVRDDKGVDTYATAANAGQFMQRRGWRTALVATQWFHIPRTRLALERVGVTVVGSRYARYAEWRDVYSALREILGYTAYYTGLRSAPGAYEPVEGA